jgi:type III secretory pathway component EscU
MFMLLFLFDVVRGQNVFEFGNPLFKFRVLTPQLGYLRLLRLALFLNLVQPACQDEQVFVLAVDDVPRFVLVVVEFDYLLVGVFQLRFEGFLPVACPCSSTTTAGPLPYQP